MEQAAPPDAAVDPVAALERAMTVLRSADAAEADRRAAATVLVGRPAGPDWAGPVMAALDPAIPTASRTAVAAAIGALGSADPIVLPPLRGMLGDSDPAAVRAGLLGLQAFRSQEAVGAVIALLQRNGGGRSDGLSEASVECLKAQTGMVEIGSDPERWISWWERSQFLREAEWRGQIADAQARRAATALESNRRTARALTELYRRLYTARPDEERSELLAEMVQSEAPEVREAGLELVQRRLLNASPVNDSTVRAIIARLADPRAAIRLQAARILERMDRPESIEPVISALTAERDADAAAALLRAAARRPDARLPTLSLAWFGTPTAADGAAIEALLSSATAGTLTDGATIERVREGLLERSGSNLTGPALALLARLGEWERIVPLLLSDDRARAQTAARALEGVQPALEELVAAASIHADLAPIAIGALARFQPTAEGLRQAVALVPPNPGEEAPPRIVAFAGTLAPDELLEFALTEQRPAVMEAVVGPVLTPAYLTRPDWPVERIDLAMAVARARLALDRPADALEVIDPLPIAEEGPRLAALRVEALLRLNRLREAIEASDRPGDEHAARLISQAWLNALAASAREVFAPGMAQVFVSRYSASLTGRQRSRLDALLELIGFEGPPEPEQSESPPPPPP